MTKELTFNDLPMVVAQLRDEVVGMKQILWSVKEAFRADMVTYL